MCKDSIKRFDSVCEKLENIYENCYEEPAVEQVDQAVAEPESNETLVVCSGVCEKCVGCPCAVAHEFNEILDTEGVCDDVGIVVKSIKV